MSNFKKPSQAELQKKLTRLQYEVTQKDATEPPFQNTYWDNHREGIYVDVVSGEALFSSRDKFDSGTGWPSFTKPLDESAVTTKTDRSLFGHARVEVRSKVADSHLGHVFDDGPKPSGKRYCMNSASLRFVAKEDLEKEGYSQYKTLFEKKAVDSNKKDNLDDVLAKANSCAIGAPGGPAGCATSYETAVLAGGCFWGMEEILRKVDGVIETEVGYAGGSTANPTYNDVKKGTTGHAESIRIVFDPAKLSYATLLEKWFFKMHNPTTLNQQGNDIGSQYRSAIFFMSEAQEKTAREVTAKVEKAGYWKKSIVTEVTKAGKFYPAESYHQDYLQENPGGYTCHYVREF